MHAEPVSRAQGAGHEYDGGIIITASHLPYNRNGFKFCTAAGGFDKSQISDLLKRAAKVGHTCPMHLLLVMLVL